MQNLATTFWYGNEQNVSGNLKPDQNPILQLFRLYQAFCFANTFNRQTFIVSSKTEFN